jgi:hypothetical protein
MVKKVQGMSPPVKNLPFPSFTKRGFGTSAGKNPPLKKGDQRGI